MAENNILRVEVVPEVKTSEADKKIEKDLTESGKKAGKKSAEAFGKVFAQALILDQAASAVRNFGVTAFNSARKAKRGEALFAGAVTQSVNKQRERLIVLKDETASLEQKALALGVNTDAIYEEVKAGDASVGQKKALRAQINKTTLAYEEQTNEINSQINALEESIKKEEEKILREKGYGKLVDEQKKRELELAKLDESKKKALLEGDIIKAAIAQQDIDRISDIQDVTEASLKVIELEAEQGSESLSKLNKELEETKKKLEDAETKFDLDVAPAQKQLDLLSTQVSSGGSTYTKVKDGFTEAIEKGIADAETTLNNLGGVDKTNEELSAEAQRQAEAAVKRLEGPVINFIPSVGDLSPEDRAKLEGLSISDIIPTSELNKASADLVLAGVKTDELDGLLAGLIQTAAVGKTEFVTMGEALLNLSEQFRTNRAALGETAGLTEEYLSEILPSGFKILQAEGEFVGRALDDLNLEEKARVARAGLEPIFDRTDAPFLDLLLSGDIQIEKFNKDLQELMVTVGQPILDSFVALLSSKEFQDSMAAFTKFVTENKDLIVKLAGAFAILLTVFSAIAQIKFLFTIFDGLSKIIPLVLKLVPIFQGILDTILLFAMLSPALFAVIVAGVLFLIVIFFLFKDEILAIFGAILEFIGWVFGKIFELLLNSPKIAREVAGAIGNFFKAGFEGFLKIAKFVFDILWGFFKATLMLAGVIITAIVGFFMDIPNKIGNMWQKIKDSFPGLISSFGDLGKKIVDKILEFFKGLPGKAKSIFIDMINFVIKLLNEALVNNYNKAIELANKVPGIDFPFLPSIPDAQFATGTRNFMGNLAVVNEQGPEARIGRNIYNNTETNNNYNTDSAVYVFGTADVSLSSTL